MEGSALVREVRIKIGGRGLARVVPDCTGSVVDAPLNEPVDNAPQGSMIGASEMMVK